MANKIKLTRGTKANIEANKSSLETYQIVYATDTSEIGVKKANGNMDYFPAHDIPEWAKTEPPSALRYLQMNANNTVTWRTAAQLRGDIGAATPANITTAVSTHNESPTAHADIREYVDSKTMKLINTGSSTALSKTGYITLTVPSDSYAGKTVAVEIRYGSSSSTTYTNQVIYVTLGTNTSTEASKTYPRFITLSEWDGEYLKHISVKVYVNSGTTTTINFGYVKTLIGRFTGSTIDWTTQVNDTINVYIGKVWLVG